MPVELRTETHQIKRSNKHFKVIDELCLKSKNIYNRATYLERQCYIQTGRLISYTDLYHYMKQEPVFKELPNGIAQQTLRQVTTNFHSFLRASKEYRKSPKKFKGKPKLPKYKKKKDARCSLEFTQDTFHTNKKSQEK